MVKKVYGEPRDEVAVHCKERNSHSPREHVVWCSRSPVGKLDGVQQHIYYIVKRGRQDKNILNGENKLVLEVGIAKSRSGRDITKTSTRGS